MRLISAMKAYQIASQWGSYMESGDPGACFYGFPVNDGRPQDQEHRHACLNYIENLLNKEMRTKSAKRELLQLERWFLYCQDQQGETEHGQ